MGDFFSTILTLPTAFYTVLLGVVVGYWLLSAVGLAGGEMIDGWIGGDGHGHGAHGLGDHPLVDGAHHPQHGMVSPLEFIPLAKESGLIHEIGDWVFGQAADALAQLGRPLQISVNASAKQLASPHFGVAHWGARLDALGIARQSISLEITESVLVEDSPQVRQCLTDFRTQGIEVSIDDFGTGFSSLAYLKKFDIDYLKVDASFVRGLAHDENDRIIVEAIIVMAHKLGIKTIAEGVETPEQRAILGTLQCDYAQGYLFSRPVPLPEFERFLAHAGS